MIIPKYILKKAEQLNQLEAKKEKLVNEITHWLLLSGQPYADLHPYNQTVKELKRGSFENAEKIEQALLEH